MNWRQPSWDQTTTNLSGHWLAWSIFSNNFLATLLVFSVECRFWSDAHGNLAQKMSWTLGNPISKSSLLADSSSTRVTDSKHNVFTSLRHNQLYFSALTSPRIEIQLGITDNSFRESDFIRWMLLEFERNKLKESWWIDTCCSLPDSRRVVTKPKNCLLGIVRYHRRIWKICPLLPTIFYDLISFWEFLSLVRHKYVRESASPPRVPCGPGSSMFLIISM